MAAAAEEKGERSGGGPSVGLDRHHKWRTEEEPPRSIDAGVLRMCRKGLGLLGWMADCVTEKGKNLLKERREEIGK